MFYAGCVVGIIIGVILGAYVSPDKITNNIGKIKKNMGEVDINQANTKQPKKGLFKRIFKRKNK